MPSGEAGIEIIDPEDPENHSICIVYRKKTGSDPKKPPSYEYSYANRWDLAAEQEVEMYEPEPVSREEIETVLARHGSSPEKVLKMYCQKLREKKIS